MSPSGMPSFLNSLLQSVSGHHQHAGLSAEEVAQYQEQGFLGPFTAFDEDEMAEACTSIYERVLTSPNPLNLYACQARHLDSETIWRICSAPSILERLQAIEGPDLMVWYSNVFDKSPEQPMLEGEYPWHQDAWHGDLSVHTMGVWLALTPTTPENGCVELIPRSHRGDVTYLRTQDPRYASWFGGLVASPAELDESQKIIMPLRPGQYFIFNERILHHSGPNLTATRRTGLSFRVAAPRFQSDQIEPCVMLSGRDEFGVNEFALPPCGEPSLTFDARNLPDARGYRMEQRLFGLGWHLPEQDGERHFRWTGPERVAWLDLAWRGSGNGLLCCQILHAAGPHLLEGLQILVNEEPIQLGWEQVDGVVQVTGQVSAGRLASNAGRVRVSLVLPETIRPSSTDPTNHDARNIGLAICGLSISELSSNHKPH